MTTSRRPPLELEPLDARVLPSVTPHAVPLPPVAAALAPAPSAAVHILDGHGHGTYTSDLAIPDVGTTYHFTGTADLAGMGRVTVSGSVTSVGFIQSGRAHGFLTFSNAKGSVTLEIFGPPQAGFAALPERFNFNVVGRRTGEFAHLSAKGTLKLALQALPTGDLPGPHGTFQLTVGSPKPPGSL